jgi:ferredoxin
MTNLVFHKGTFCVYAPVFCQEGYCSGCEVYLKKSSPPKKRDQLIGILLQETLLAKGDSSCSV